MSKLQPHSEYKASGIEWLPRIPKHWHLNKISRISKLTVGWTPPTGEASSFEGNNLWANISDLGPRVLSDTSKRISDDAVATSRITMTPKGSLLFSFKLSVGQVSFAGRDMYTNEAIATFLETKNIMLQYAYYAFPLFIGENAIENIYGAKLLNQSLIGQARIALPSVDEQKAMATFLDAETAEIDTFIEDQNELIELLNERRAATITKAITKGLDPDVPMQDSHVEWLGKVPASWHVSRIARYYDVVLGKMLDAGQEVHPDAEVLPYIRAANIQDAGLDLSVVNSMPFTPDQAENLSIRSGDLLVVEGGKIGTSYLVLHDMDGWSFQKTVNRVRSKGTSLTSFLQYVLRSLRDSNVLGVLCNVSTIAHLTAEKLLNLRVPIPPPREQQAIVDYLNYETGEIDAAIADAKEAIDLSKERRAALIFDVVTGKVDVRSHITAEVGAA
ncbi:restriction endonuclease subunit S [Arthrobacter sp. SLBN-122]|uniref:restriction endonuclease subunit S n=1 Tax=Arthrobacter sp. SLBN-122 TaxID=2768455 RepID=UPI00115321DE|nr:restriction endonuclease subunit S [Arthrobacter sp. SLBN-122]TQJ33051.1 type I restriction enzyme S subunit [Arthrobacter sp. SLBN-122]